MCDTFSCLVFNVSRMLTKEDIEAIAYLYKVPVDLSVSGSVTNGLFYLRELEKRDTFSSANLSGLKQLLNFIQRSDLIELVEEFEKKRKKLSVDHQQYIRPQEECIRLDMSYAQAKALEQELGVFQKEFTSFCSRLGNESSVKPFYGSMVRRLKEMKERCQQYIVTPIREIIHLSYLMMPNHTHMCGGVQGRQQCHGDQQYKSHPYQQPVATTLAVNAPVEGYIQHQGNLDHLSYTSKQGHAQHAPKDHRMQTTAPVRIGLATHHSQQQQTHFSSSLPNTGRQAPTAADYNVMSPIVIATEPTTENDGAHTLVKESKYKTVDRKCRSNSAPRPTSGMTRQDKSGELESHRTSERRQRISNSSSDIPILLEAPGVTASPMLKRAGSADNVQSSPSRIPKLHQLYNYNRGKQVSSCSSGSLCSDSDFSCSTDSGIEIRTGFGKQQTSSDLSLHSDESKSTGNKNRKHTKLYNKALEAPTMPHQRQSRRQNS